MADVSRPDGGDGTNRTVVMRTVQDGRQVCIMTDWSGTGNSFEVRVTDGRCSWLGIVTQPPVVAYEGWREKAVEALTGDGKVTRFTFVLEEEGSDRVKLKWIWQEGVLGGASNAPGAVPSGPRKVGIAKLQRLSDGDTDDVGLGRSVDTIRTVMACAAELNVALQRDNASLHRDLATLRTECDRAHGELEKFTTVKERTESDLYHRFALVLNEKKRRIRYLEERLDTAEDEVDRLKERVEAGGSGGGELGEDTRDGADEADGEQSDREGRDGDDDDKDLNEDDDEPMMTQRQVRMAPVSARKYKAAATTAAALPKVMPRVMPPAQGAPTPTTAAAALVPITSTRAVAAKSDPVVSSSTLWRSGSGGATQEAAPEAPSLTPPTLETVPDLQGTYVEGSIDMDAPTQPIDEELLASTAAAATGGGTTANTAPPRTQGVAVGAWGGGAGSGGFDLISDLLSDAGAAVTGAKPEAPATVRPTVATTESQPRSSQSYYNAPMSQLGDTSQLKESAGLPNRTSAGIGGLGELLATAGEGVARRRKRGGRGPGAAAPVGVDDGMMSQMLSQYDDPSLISQGGLSSQGTQSRAAKRVKKGVGDHLESLLGSSALE